MKYLKMFETHSSQSLRNPFFKDAIAKNWKQKNAIIANKKVGFGGYKHNEKGDTEYTLKIKKFLDERNFRMSSDKTHFYFVEKIPAGTVRGYQNCYITSVHISSEYNVTFNINFEVENPFINEINILKKEEKKYEKLSDKEFEEKKNDWEKLYNDIKKLDTYIPNFTYAYSQDIDPTVIENVYNEMIRPVNIDRTKHIQDLYQKKHKLLYNIEKLPYKDRLDYWDLYDEYEDLVNYRTPSEVELNKRQDRRNKSEEQYNKEQEKIIKMFKDI
jgi:hypothetical protein